jgi:hypothetical protein
MCVRAEKTRGFIEKCERKAYKLIMLLDRLYTANSPPAISYSHYVKGGKYPPLPQTPQVASMEPTEAINVNFLDGLRDSQLRKCAGYVAGDLVDTIYPSVLC